MMCNTCEAEWKSNRSTVTSEEKSKENLFLSSADQTEQKQMKVCQQKMQQRVVYQYGLLAVLLLLMLVSLNLNLCSYSSV
jgi:hypothetical protein